MRIEYSIEYGGKKAGLGADIDIDDFVANEGYDKKKLEETVKNAGALLVKEVTKTAFKNLKMINDGKKEDEIELEG